MMRTMLKIFQEKSLSKELEEEEREPFHALMKTMMEENMYLEFSCNDFFFKEIE